MRMPMPRSVRPPTRVALMTGRYPQRSGFDWVIDYTERDRGLPPTEAGLARRMKAQGYVTGAFGKWHLGYRPEYGPNAHGFDEFFGFLAADLDYYAHTEAEGAPGLYENTMLVERSGYLTDLISDRAVSFIDKHRSDPFFLYVPYNAPHWPFQPPNRPQDVRDKESYGPRNGTRADYIQMVREMDRGVGRILRALDAAEVAKNTLVIFTNDNGGERFSDNRPYFHGKYTVWEGGIRVPCLIRWPGKLPRGAVSDQQMMTMDLTATILGVAGVPGDAIQDLDGKDLMPVLMGRKRPLDAPSSGEWPLRRAGKRLQGGGSGSMSARESSCSLTSTPIPPSGLTWLIDIPRSSSL